MRQTCCTLSPEELRALRCTIDALKGADATVYAAIATLLLLELPADEIDRYAAAGCDLGSAHIHGGIRSLVVLVEEELAEAERALGFAEELLGRG